jgi:hypothetical protein
MNNKNGIFQFIVFQPVIYIHFFSVFLYLYFLIHYLTGWVNFGSFFGFIQLRTCKKYINY